MAAKKRKRKKSVKSKESLLRAYREAYFGKNGQPTSKMAQASRDLDDAGVPMMERNRALWKGPT
jgi:hypothetical protein